jgi:hypothetical protein
LLLTEGLMPMTLQGTRDGSMTSYFPLAFATVPTPTTPCYDPTLHFTAVRCTTVVYAAIAPNTVVPNPGLCSRSRTTPPLLLRFTFWAATRIGGPKSRTAPREWRGFVAVTVLWGTSAYPHTVSFSHSWRKTEADGVAGVE